MYFLLLLLLVNCRKGELWSPEKASQEYLKANPSKAEIQAGVQTPQPRNDSIPPKMIYLDNGIIKLGVDINMGGAVTYLSPSKNEKNVINNWAIGRQVGMSFYGSPVPYSVGSNGPAKGWEHTGWNPVQTGDLYGNPSKTLDFKNDGKTLYVKTLPLQWALWKEPCECTMESWYELDGNTVKVRNRINNNRQDRTFYTAHFQELPAVYTNAEQYRVITYSGSRPFTNDPNLTSIDSKNGSYHFAATENWSALLQDDNWGLGIWKPDTYVHTGGFWGTPNVGGTYDFATGYVAPVENEIFDYNIQYDFSYVMILGTLSEIRNYAYTNSKTADRLPNYRFEKDRQHWYYTDGTKDTGFPINGALMVYMDQPLTELYGPWGYWRAAEVSKIYITAAFQTDKTTARLYWMREPQEKEFLVKRSITFKINPDGQYHTYELDVTTNPEWQDMISRLMLAPIDREKGTSGHWVKIKSISYKP